jgi:hypothetical protein
MKMKQEKLQKGHENGKNVNGSETDTNLVSEHSRAEKVCGTDKI